MTNNDLFRREDPLLDGEFLRHSRTRDHHLCKPASDIGPLTCTSREL